MPHILFRIRKFGGVDHLRTAVKTVADRKILQTQSLSGCEPKTLPYLLCQMNLLLQGLDAPQIDPGNSLCFKLTDISGRDHVVVATTAYRGAERL